LEIRYLDNSGFCVFLNETTLIMDYYNDFGTDDIHALDHGVITKDAVKRNEKTYVLSSHVHYDHFNRCIFDLKKHNSNIKYILDSGIKLRNQSCDIKRLKRGEIYKDEHIFIKAFGSTDIGISYLIKAEGKTIFHAGDLNYWHWKEEASVRYAARAKRMFLKILDDIERENCEMDLLFFPVDYRMGNDGDAGAKIMLERFKPKMFVPMHFSNKYSGLEKFKASMKNDNIWAIKKRGDILYYT
jgi:L-ascorbate metabolism protein UlaG (beta-lactamase superfamily)